MKLKYLLTSTLAAMLLATACNDDEMAEPQKQPQPEATSRLTFAISNSGKGIVHYPGTKAIATEAENNIDTLDVYVFGRDKTKESEVSYVLETVYRGFENMQVNPNGDVKEVTISVSEGTKYFYFVANGRNQRSLDEVVLDKTTKDDFRKKLTNTQSGLLAAPLLMTDTCEYAVSDDGNTVTVNGKAHTAGDAIAVTLKRRMARFDVKNDKYGSQFILEKITLKGVPEKNSLIDGIDFGADTTFRADALPAIDFTEFENANVGESPSVFYMYPVNATKAQNVSLLLEGTNLDGKTRQVYNLDLKKTQESADYMSIESNYRYILSIKSVDSKKLTAILSVEEWIVGDTVKVNTDLGSIVLDVPTVDEENKPINTFKGWNWTFDNTADKNILEVPADAILGDSLTIAVAAESEWNIKADSLYDWIELSEVEAGLQKKFRVTTTKANPNQNAVREATVLVYNNFEPSINQPLVIRQKANTDKYINLTGNRLAGDELYLTSGAISGEKVTVGLPAAITSWDVTKRALCDWITVNKEADASGFTLDATANDDYTERTDTLYLTADYTISTNSGDKQTPTQNLERRLIVRQTKKSLGNIELIPHESQELNATAQTVKVSVKASSEWEAIVSGDGALSITGDKTGKADSEITLTVAENTGKTGRKDTLLVQNKANKNIFQKLAFRQAPASPTLSATSVVMDKAGTVTSPAGGEITITDMDAGDVNNWELLNVPEWLTATYTAATNKITLTTNAKTELKEGDVNIRKATLVFRHKEYPTATRMLIQITQENK